MHVFGFSINALTLFGLVLAIGIVVDDAIVVVENVERNIEAGLTPREATYQAMREVSGPIIAIALVLVAVFVPLAFISGLTGQFYKQFALTIAISTVISAINSLTLSPALAALLLKGHDAPQGRADARHGLRVRLVLPRLQPGVQPRLRRLQRRRRRRHLAQGAGAGRLPGADRRRPSACSRRCRAASCPAQDKQYLVGFAQLPDGATLDRTEDVIRRMSEIALKQPGRRERGRVPGPVDQRLHQQLERRHRVRDAQALRRAQARRTCSGAAIAGSSTSSSPRIQDAFIAMFPPPPVQGLGTIGGFKLQIEDRAALGYEALDRRDQGVHGQGLRRRRSSPGLFIELPGQRAAALRRHRPHEGAPARRAVTDVFDTMQIYLGSLYVNDFNKFGRTYSVRVQADAPYRARAEDIGPAEGALEHRRDGPAVGAAEGEAERRARARHALQRLPRADINGGAGAGLLLGPGAGSRRAHRRRDAAARASASSGPS